jgi:hypothetical protein
MGLNIYVMGLNIYVMGLNVYLIRLNVYVIRVGQIRGPRVEWVRMCIYKGQFSH